ncbi:Valyl-tRNA synthetase [Gryllus bimaculatus]|nr:Valyl-tRNA synthetase [Gryllus bimaculatus]
MMFKICCQCCKCIEYVSPKWISGTPFRYPFTAGKHWLQKHGFRNKSFGRGFQTLSDSYSPSDVEYRMHEIWFKHKDRQTPAVRSHTSSEHFSMILPPPNVTGTLHLGHSLTVTIQDVLARWQRMQGKRVLWIPGFDHAGIATQTAFERKLWKEKRQTRYDLGRENFEKELWNWKKEKQSYITNQLRNIGASLDWSHQYFTLDSKHSETVANAFIHLHSNGLIYRSESIVNWCCELQSAISDIEVNHIEINGHTLLDVPNYEGPVEFGVLSNFAYKTPDGSDELVVSTTRLETMLGDTAVAVNPNDSRYLDWHGRHVMHPFLRKTIPVVCDESVDPHFGTGVVKVTPAHSLIDCEIGKKHCLEFVPVIDERGIMNDQCDKFKGLKRFEAREKIKDELVKLGLFRGQKHHTMSVPVCSRTGDIIEFLLKPQWFLSCQEMAKVAIAAVEKEELLIIPSSYNNVWFTWLRNIRDWCISRQLWWGHRIPAYECTFTESAKTVWVAAENIDKARDIAVLKLKLNPEDRERINIVQDLDVLDTWFSSALLPFSSLGWPQETSDLKDFYPLSVMETGHDILFFWVARMVMLSTYLTGKLPFKNVVLHGVVCDSYGRKMSKSLGNVIDPQDVIIGAAAESLLKNAHANYDFGLISAAELKKTLESNKVRFPNGIPECGSDALRFTLCSINIANAQINFDVDLCYKNRQFCTKIWQACRYIQTSYKNVFAESETLECAPPKYLSLNSNDCVIATMSVQEGTKPIVRACDSSSVRTIETLLLCIDVALRALSPFMPFITEHLYQHLPLRNKEASLETITLASYPSSQEWASSRNENIEEEIQDVLSVVSGLRHLQSTYGITKTENAFGVVECSSTKSMHRYMEHISLICTLSGVKNVEVTSHVNEKMKNDAMYMDFYGKGSIYLKTVKKKDESKEYQEKMRRYKVALKSLEKLYKITSHPGYSTSAPEKVQLKHKQNIATLEAEIHELKKYQEHLETKNR